MSTTEQDRKDAILEGLIKGYRNSPPPADGAQGLFMLSPESKFAKSPPLDAAVGLFLTKEQVEELIQDGPRGLRWASFFTPAEKGIEYDGPSVDRIKELEKTKQKQDEEIAKKDEQIRKLEEDRLGSRPKNRWGLIRNNAGKILFAILAIIVYLKVTGNLEGVFEFGVLFAIGCFFAFLNSWRWTHEEVIDSFVNIVPYVIILLVQPRDGLAQSPSNFVLGAELFAISQAAGFFDLSVGQPLLWRLWKRWGLWRATLITSVAPFAIAMGIYWFLLQALRPSEGLEFTIYGVILLCLALITLAEAIAKSRETGEPLEIPNHRVEQQRRLDEVKKEREEAKKSKTAKAA